MSQKEQKTPPKYQPRNVVGNRFFLRVSEDLKSLSLNLKARSMRISQVPRNFRNGRRGNRASNLSHMSSVSLAAEYHRSAEGKSRMQQTSNPGFQQGTGTRKGLKSTMREILNEVEPGINSNTAAVSGVYQAPFPEDDAAIKLRDQRTRRVCFFRGLFLLVLMALVGLVSGVVMSGSNGRADPLTGNPETGLPVDGTLGTSSPTLSPTTPAPTTLSPTTGSPTTKSPTPGCVFFCG